MSTQKKRTANVDQIKAILSITDKVRTVEVEGVSIELSVPDLDDAQRLRSVVTQSDPEDAAKMGLVLATEALIACVRGLDKDTALKLVLISGGELGPLAMEALNLCGVGNFISKAIEEGKADPTS